jgi:hypothetical protein
MGHHVLHNDRAVKWRHHVDNESASYHPRVCGAVAAGAVLPAAQPGVLRGSPGGAACLARGDGVDAGAGYSVDGGKSGVASCTSNAQCTSPTPICDTTRSMCVQCTADQPGACGGTTPACGDDDTCRGSLAYSDGFAGTVALLGAGNLLVDPLVVDVLHGDLHLRAASPVRNAADPAATLADDIDGDARPQGAGRDMGADEIQ